tara:strand:- start:1175 stop:1960 length:786 start_codon:yes stop_codon:yes gene_type:complete
MKKNILAFLFLTFISFNINAQCTPDPQYYLGGIYPDSATGLSDAYVGMPYNELITIITPTDTTVDAGAITGLPIGIVNVDIDSITLDNVTGLPSNFSYYCDPPSCGFIGGTTQCAELYSTTNPTASQIGSYQIIFETTAYVSGIPLIGSTTQQDVIDYYYLNIVDNTPVVEYLENNTFSFQNIIPNPVNSYAEIQFVSGNNDDVMFEVYNILGEKIFIEFITSNRGINKINMNTLEYPDGIYICSLYNGVSVISKRMIISH